jgi:hypothetical protein
MPVVNNANLGALRDGEVSGLVGAKGVQTRHLDLKKTSVVQNRRQAREAKHVMETAEGAMIALSGGKQSKRNQINEPSSMFNSENRKRPRRCGCLVILFST